MTDDFVEAMEAYQNAKAVYSNACFSAEYSSHSVDRVVKVF